MNYRNMKKQAGVTLMELLAGLAVMAVIVAGALSLYTGASSSQLSTQMTQDMVALRAAVKQMYNGQGNYGTANMNNILVTSKRVPTTITVDTTTTPNTLTHKGNGTINVAGNTNTYTITATNIEPDVCVPLMTGATGWTSVKVGTNTAQTTFPISPATAATDCGTAAATMVFTGN